VKKGAHSLNGAGAQFDDGRNQCRAEYSKGVENHPHTGTATRSSLMAGGAAVTPFVRRWLGRRGHSLPKLGCCHICFADLEKIATV
jgi:hypothetical protein